MSSAPIAAAITAIVSVDTPASVVLLLRICARSTADNNDGVDCGHAAHGVVPVSHRWCTSSVRVVVAVVLVLVVLCASVSVHRERATRTLARPFVCVPLFAALRWWCGQRGRR